MCQGGQILTVCSTHIPKYEDFGMSPLESMVAGKQVVGVAGGVVRNCDIAINRNFA